jgi:hypothetical protein
LCYLTQILEEVNRENILAGKNVMTVHARTEEYDVHRKVWETPDIQTSVGRSLAPLDQTDPTVGQSVSGDLPD